MGDLSNKSRPIRKPFFTMEMGLLVELILTVVSWIMRDFQSRNCILQNSLSPRNFKAGKSASRQKFVQKHRILKSHCSGSQNIAIDSGENRFPRLRDAGRTDGVFIENVSQLACSLPEMSKCRRTTCSKYDRFLRGRQIAYMILQYRSS